MKIKLILLSITLLSLTFSDIKISPAFLRDSESTSATFGAGTCYNNSCEEPGEEIISTETEHLFYFRDDKKAVGFVVLNTEEYDTIHYMVDYTREPGLDERIEGNLDNSSHLDSFIKEWLTLGSCSDAGNSCVYHEVTSDIMLTLEL
jgi:hypothetical protein